MPAGALASMTACAVGLGVLAVVNWASFVVSSHNDNGGWNWDPSTGTAKRELDGNHNILLSLGAERYRHIADDIYTLDVDDGAFNGLNLNKRDSNGNMIIHKGKVVRVNNGLVSDLGYQMIVDANGHNKSMFAESDAITRAVKTYVTCGHEQECYEDGVLLKSVGNSSTSGINKRDSSGAWASYNDWGYNGGFTHDWWYWDEFSKAARSMAYDAGVILRTIPLTLKTPLQTHIFLLYYSLSRNIT